ncbi:MAG: hypothetical protein ACLQU3_05470 [Limisphaerales bacterium]
MAWPSGEDTKHLCEACYPEAEAKRTASYGPKQKPLPVIDVEHITALEYLDFAARSHANSADAPAYRHVSEELKRFPATRERLAMEMLKMALQSLEQGNESWHLIGLRSCFGSSAPPAKASAFIQLLERIVLRSVQLMAQSSNAPSDHPFGMGLTMAGNALRRADPARLSTLLEGFRAQHGELVQAPTVVNYLERRMAESGRSWRRKRGADVWLRSHGSVSFGGAAAGR